MDIDEFISAITFQPQSMADVCAEAAAIREEMVDAIYAVEAVIRPIVPPAQS